MDKSYWNEEWKDIIFDDKISEREKFKISNYGRILNCKGEKEYLVKASYTNGYQALALKQKNRKSSGRYVHKLVAQHFLEKNDGEFVIHLNYDKTDNRVENLKWATYKERLEHNRKNPNSKPRERNHYKLDETKVMLIKKRINDPNRKTRMKMIAKQFGISEMQLYRIKSGENWGDVKV